MRGRERPGWAASVTATLVVLLLYAVPVGKLLTAVGWRDLDGGGGLVVDLAYTLLGIAFLNLLAEHLQSRWGKRGLHSRR